MKQKVDKTKNYYFRTISNQVRFGYGFRMVEGKRQFFAWHGYPDRNSDYITTSEITEEEFDELVANGGLVEGCDYKIIEDEEEL